MQLLCFDLLALPWYCEVTKSDKKCKAFQNEQICSFDRKERQILFTICRHLWRTPSMRRRNVKNKMEELTHLKRSSNCDSIYIVGGLSPDIIYPPICRVSNVKMIWLTNFKLLQHQLQAYKFSNSLWLSILFRDGRMSPFKLFLPQTIMDT